MNDYMLLLWLNYKFRLCLMVYTLAGMSTSVNGSSGMSTSVNGSSGMSTSVNGSFGMSTSVNGSSGMSTSVNGSSVCPSGKYGVNCSQDCHANCYNCSNSGQCDTCKSDNVYGPLCGQSCALCKNGACDRFRCKDGCKEKLFEKKWETLPGLPQSYSCEPCPEESCMNCESHDKCTSCMSTFWGTTCKEKCQCKRCDQRSGACCQEVECLDSFEKCSGCPQNCPLYKSIDNCTTCVGERYGPTCDLVNCSSINHCLECNCDSDKCESTQLICRKCEFGFTGDKCQVNEYMGQADVAYSNDRHKDTDNAKLNEHSELTHYNHSDIELYDFNHKNITHQRNVANVETKTLSSKISDDKKSANNYLGIAIVIAIVLIVAAFAVFKYRRVTTFRPNAIQV